MDTIRLAAGIYSVTGAGGESEWFSDPPAELLTEWLATHPEIEILDYTRHDSRGYSWWQIRIPFVGADWPRVGRIVAAQRGELEPAENLESASKPGFFEGLKSDVKDTLDDAGSIVTRALLGAGAVALAVVLVRVGKSRVRK